MSSDGFQLKRVAALIVAVFAVSACSTANKHIGEEDPYFGDSVKYDTALQTINPDPVYPPSASQPGNNGERGARAVLRYRTDAVKPVESTGTTSGTTGAGMSAAPSH